MKKTIKGFCEKHNLSSKILPTILVLALVAIAYISFAKPSMKNVNENEAKTIAENFINAYLMEPGSKASILNIVEEYGLYKLDIDIVNGTVESYLTKDGKLFFPQALNIEEIAGDGSETDNSANTGAVSKTEVSVKTDKPEVELFVMSHCPFGTQIEKGILPVVEALGDNIDFKIKFNTYAMHGEKELVEQINQHCIMTEQEDLYNDYLRCFLVAGDSASCLASAKIDQKALGACFDKTDKEYKIMDNFNNKVGYQGSYPSFNISKEDNEKYGVGGSPTLVINGETISSNRDAASLLYTICSAFVTEPDACFETLSNATPAPGFGTATTNNAAAAACE